MKTWLTFFFCFVLLTAACSGRNQNSATTNSATNTSSNSSAAHQQIEKVKPAPGTGNVQGKVLYNSKPVENIEVKLCETFNRFFGGCSGKTFTARTDSDGDFVIANVEPGTYQSLLARVFDSDSFVFATTGIAGLSAEKYDVVADKTLFVAPTNLFKGDLKVLNPKAGARVSAQNLELKWQDYPDAAYYKFSLYPDESSVSSPYINERSDNSSFTLDKPLPKGTYRIQITAYNGDDRKLSETSDDIKMTVTDGS